MKQISQCSTNQCSRIRLYQNVPHKTVYRMHDRSWLRCPASPVPYNVIRCARGMALAMKHLERYYMRYSFQQPGSHLHFSYGPASKTHLCSTVWRLPIKMTIVSVLVEIRSRQKCVLGWTLPVINIDILLANRFQHRFPATVSFRHIFVLWCDLLEVDVNYPQTQQWNISCVYHRKCTCFSTIRKLNNETYHVSITGSALATDLFHLFLLCVYVSL